MRQPRNGNARSRIIAVTVSLFILGSIVTPGIQAAESDTEMIVQSHLENNRHQEARRLLRRQLASEADNPTWHRLMGQLHVQTKSFSTADDFLEQARRLGDDSPEWHRLKGIVLLNQLRSKQALNQFNKAPDSPVVKLYRAEAHVQLGQYRRAQQLLTAIGGQLPEHTSKIVTLRQTIRAQKDMRVSERMPGTTERTNASSGWKLSFNAGRGYNDNVSSRPEQSFRGTDISEQKDHFYQAQLYVRKRIHQNTHQALFLYGHASQREYDELSGFDMLTAKTGFHFTRLLDGERTVNIGGSYSDVEVGESDYSSSLSGRINYRSPTNNGVSWTGSYNFTLHDYHDNPPPDEDRDGPVHKLTFRSNIETDLSGDTLILSPFGLAGTSKTDGNDMENEFLGGGASITYRLSDRLSWKSFFKYRFRHHVNDRVVAGINVGAREDDERYYMSKLSYQLASFATLETRFSHRNNDSNFNLFTFEQNEISFNVTLDNF